MVSPWSVIYPPVCFSVEERQRGNGGLQVAVFIFLGAAAGRKQGIQAVRHHDASIRNKFIILRW
jgi:hypothetical protein